MTTTTTCRVLAPTASPTPPRGGVSQSMIVRVPSVALVDGRSARTNGTVPPPAVDEVYIGLQPASAAQDTDIRGATWDLVRPATSCALAVWVRRSR